LCGIESLKLYIQRFRNQGILLRTGHQSLARRLRADDSATLLQSDRFIHAARRHHDDGDMRKRRVRKALTAKTCVTKPPERTLIAFSTRTSSGK